MKTKSVLRTRFGLSGPKISWASSRAHRGGRACGHHLQKLENSCTASDDASNDVQRKQLDEIRKDMEYNHKCC